MSSNLDVLRLIAEVRKRPPLWDVGHGFHRARHCVPSLWQEVSQNVGIDVEQCKRKWKNLRDAYRAEVKRSERRIEKDKLMGVYNPNTNYSSKWVCFQSLAFLSEGTQTQSYAIENENTNSSSNDNIHYHEPYFHNENVLNSIKMERVLVEDDGLNLEDNEDDILLEELQNTATPQATRRSSATLSMSNSFERNSTAAQQVNAKPFTSTDCRCKCSESTDEQVYFLEGLGREEQQLMKSTKQDITHSNKFDHIGDSDYNFLVSFLPNMKKMSELQNLQFRAKMCDMVLNIFGPKTETTGNTHNNETKAANCSAKTSNE